MGGYSSLHCTTDRALPCAACIARGSEREALVGVAPLDPWPLAPNKPRSAARRFSNQNIPNNAPALSPGFARPTIPTMPQASPMASPPSSSPAPSEVPNSFFADLADSSAALAVRDRLGSPPSATLWQPQKAMYWYDSIIDDMFAHPGGTLKETAARLGRSPVTIGLIVRSDLFKSRYSQRRAAWNAEIDHRLTGKLALVAEQSLDLMLAVMEKKKDAIPLPLLNDIQDKALARLGYGVQPSPGAVNVQVNAGVAQVSVSAEALAEARTKLRAVESRNAEESAEGAARRQISSSQPHLLPSAGEVSGGPIIDGELGAL